MIKNLQEKTQEGIIELSAIPKPKLVQMMQEYKEAGDETSYNLCACEYMYKGE